MVTFFYLVKKSFLKARKTSFFLEKDALEGQKVFFYGRKVGIKVLLLALSDEKCLGGGGDKKSLMR